MQAICSVFHCGVLLLSVDWMNHALRQYQVRPEDISPLLNFISTAGAVVMNGFLLNIIWLGRPNLEAIANQAMKLTKFCKHGSTKVRSEKHIDNQ